MELLIIFAGALYAGFILGLVWGSRAVDRECEYAYLSGHVDGYRKAQDDAGEVLP